MYDDESHVLEAFNAGCQYAADVAYEQRCANKVALQPMVYGTLRERFGLGHEKGLVHHPRDRQRRIDAEQVEARHGAHRVEQSLVEDGQARKAALAHERDDVADAGRVGHGADVDVRHERVAHGLGGEAGDARHQACLRDVERPALGTHRQPGTELPQHHERSVGAASDEERAERALEDDERPEDDGERRERTLQAAPPVCGQARREAPRQEIGKDVRRRHEERQRHEHGAAARGGPDERCGDPDGRATGHGRDGAGSRGERRIAHRRRAAWLGGHEDLARGRERAHGEQRREGEQEGGHRARASR